MKATGIVRRIDDLGRVVIPKEIRRTMRIKEGSPLEIFTSREGEVIFKKYSPVGELSEFVDIYAETINKSTKNTALITDKDMIVAVSGEHKKKLYDKKITEDLDTLLEKRSPYVYKIGDKRIRICEDTENCHAGIVYPVIADSDVVGGIIVLIRDDGAAPTESDFKVVEASASLLSKQIEV